MSPRPSGMSTSQPTEDSEIPLIHDPDALGGSSYAGSGLDDAPTQVRPHSALLSAGASTTTPADGPSPQVLGARLDHFELLDSIGVGGMGRVFRARDTRLDRLVALKVLSPELSNEPEVCRRFEQEAKAAARLDDRHFARVYFFGFDKGLRYIAMEYVEGENIRQKINKLGRLSLPLVINVGVQVAQGLSHAASCGVVHRDIKPSNIILTPDGTAKLVDMGLARNFFQQSSPASELTQAGVTLGTFDYISPEQALDPRDADVRSDIYSLGCTLYHALTGQPPFSKGSALQKILQHQNDSVPDPRRFVPDMPDDMVAILLKMLAKDPKDRYQHPVELIEDLRAVAFSLDIQLPDEIPYRPVARTQAGFWETHLTWVLPLAILLASLGVYAWLDQVGYGTSIARPVPPLVEDQASPTTSVTPVRTPPLPTVAATTPVRPSLLVPVEGSLAQAIRQANPGVELRLAGNHYVMSEPDEGATLHTLVMDKSLRLVPDAPSGLVEIEVRSGAWGNRGDGEGSSLIRVRNGSLEMERLAWIIKSPGDSNFSRALFSVAGGKLSLQNCFVRIGGGKRQEPLGVVHMDSSDARKPSVLVARKCLFHGADEAIRVASSGNSEVELLDCAFDEIDRTPFSLEGLGDVTWTMEHCTVRARTSPIWQIQRLGGVRIQSRESVFAYVAKAGDAEIAFVDFSTDGAWASRTDSWWSGRGNLFHGFEPLIVSRAGQAVARSLRQARGLGLDETVFISLESREPLWELTDESPLAVSIDSGRPILDRLRLAKQYAEREKGPLGVRDSAWGNLYGKDREPARVQTPSTDAPPATPSGLAALIVDPSTNEGTEPNVFSNLNQALDHAGPTASIELRVNGLAPASPLTLRERSITLKPTAGYAPVLMWDAMGTKNDAPLFDLDGSSKLAVHGVPLVIRTDGERNLAVAQLQPGSECSIQDSPIHIDGNLMKSKALLVRGTGGKSTTDSPIRVSLIRSTLRTSGSVFIVAPGTSAEFSIADSFLVAAQPVLGREGNRATANLKIERSTLLLGESLLVQSGAEAAADSSVVRIVSNDSILMGFGSAPLWMSITAGNQPGTIPAQWLSERTFLAGFSTGWVDVGNSASQTVRKSTLDELKPNSIQGNLTVGEANPYVLGAGGIKTVQVPLLSQLRKWGYPEETTSVLGVPAQVLPPEPTLSQQRP